MSRIHFEKVRFRNFRSYGGSWTTVDLDQQGLCSIGGVNGAGKTSVLSALVFVIYGVSSDFKGGTKKTLPVTTLINDVNKKEMEVELIFSKGTDKYKIIRGLKPNKFEIWKNGQNLANTSSKTIDQVFLEEEVLDGMTREMFMNTVYLSAKVVSVPIVNMKTAERREFIETLLDMRIFYYMNDVLKKKISMNKLTFSKVESELELTKQALEHELKNIERLERMKQEQEQKAEDSKEDIQRQISEIEKEIGDLGPLETERSKLGETRDNLDRTKRDLSGKIEKLKQEMIRRKIEHDQYNKNKDRFALCGDCPTVSKIIGEFDVEKYEEFVKKSKEIGLKLQEELKKLEEQINENGRLLKELSSKESQVFAMNQRKNLLKGELNKVVESIEVDLSYKEELEEKVKTVEQKYDKAVVERDALKEIKDAIGDNVVKEQIIDNYIPILEMYANDLLERFMENDNFSPRLEISKSFDITVFKDGKEINMFSLSEGQKESLNFAMIFSFIKLIETKQSFDTNLLMIDEILDAKLDSERLNLIVGYLKETTVNKTVFIISHSNNINKEMFDKNLKITMDRFSRIEVE